MIPFLNQKFFALDFLRSFALRDIGLRCEELLKVGFPEKRAFFTYNAKTAFFATLTCLKGIYPKKKVILPVYTDSGLVTAIKKASLIPIFCDVSLKDFNLDINEATALIDDDTLAVLFPYMFGVPSDISGLLEYCRQRNVFLIEDFAQGFCSKFKLRRLGAFAPFSFTSLARGKNLSTYSGGILFADAQYSKVIGENINKLEVPGSLEGLKDIFLYLAVCALSKPWVFSLLRALAAPYRSASPLYDFRTAGYAKIKLHLLYSQLANAEKLLSCKTAYGRLLHDTLKNEFSQIILPQINDEMEVCFNRLPVVVKEKEKLPILRKRLEKCGIESDYFYGKTLIEVFPWIAGLQKRESFPNAQLLADNLLVLPVNCYTDEKVIAKICKIFKETL